MGCFKQYAKSMNVIAASVLCVGLFSACAANKNAETSVADNSTPPPVDCSKSALERSLEKEPASDRGVTGFFKNLFVETGAVVIDSVSPIPVATTAHEAHGVYTTAKIAERAYSDKDCNNSTTAKP